MTLLRVWILLALFLSSTVAFTVQQSATTSTVALQTSRRDVLAGIASSGLVVGTALVSSTPAVAAVDDLSMPSEDEQKAAEKAALEAKLKRKAELQKAATQPKTFTGSFQSEIQKQKDFGSQTKEQRRNAMCEELGRGC
mmetsp:Transcript_130/g.505  ORF Transcript_130/g.505 Transcript_130/m.505 type:complete len:139 (+) Transcript_130:94-510(+)|eukprot:CAMPEP_0168847542 /NCGR_PEP_ID=MMETSP0727-20121128/10372_1 /TAXON_ID=265536 /ORGANISM="Amphiprora sp., Strain CCMP467" /LENGTH=138 /DNA_ID=CAMNT_0008901351 /DNA_START=23 /DNA_END=439 /DNA_ORIENTATION=-